MDEEIFRRVSLDGRVLSGCAKEQDPEPVVLRESEDYYAVYAGEMTTFDYLVTNSAAEYDALANCVDTWLNTTI